MTRRRRQALAAAAIALLACSALVGGLMLSGGAPAAAPAGGELPTALGQHLAQLRQAVPGTGGMAEEGPASAAAADYAARAYPDTAVAVSDVETSRASWSAQQGRPFPKGKGRPGTWVTVGPSQAVYPDSPFLTSFLYVPNRYVAGGRTTDLAISDTCRPGNCRMWITPAGGGVWRTRNALSGQPHWEYLGGPLGINAAGSVEIDRNDPSGNTIYVGTGEANICGSGCAAGTGIYKSTDGGDTFTLLTGLFKGMGVGDIRIKPGDPDTIYAATTTALTGMSAVCCSGVTRPTPGAPKWGLYKSTDGGANWSFIHNGSVNAAECTGSIPEFNNAGTCSPRGVRHIEFDPSNPETIYASSYARGIWRSDDEGATWQQIKPPLINTTTDRAAIAVNALADGSTRMYVYEGFGGGNPASRLYRSDNANAAAPVFQDLTSPSVADPGWAWNNICAPQCWYDVFVHSPEGHPDIVYAGGDYFYGEHIANKRGVILSTDAGVSGTDMTFDGTDPLHPNGLHPDQHAIVTHPDDPLQFFEANDGGVMRSNGELVDRSEWCDLPGRGGSSEATKARCRQMLSAIPERLESMNKGLSTLQFTKLSASPHNSNLLQGGTQDNGTWESPGNPVQWENTMIGDGGWNGFDVELEDFRFHSFFDVSPEVSFDGGSMADWIWVADPIYNQFDDGPSEFYSPIISDPVVSGTMFAGTTLGVYRTKTHGLGDMDYEEAQRRCNTWTGAFDGPCGDWTKVDSVKLDSTAYGADKEGGAIAAVERTTADTSTAWAATTRGRVFVSSNVDAEPAGAVTWTRLDDDSPLAPNRFVSSIYVDPEDPTRAWVSFSGYGVNTPGQPGHVFLVEYDGATSTWTDLSYDFGDTPVTDLVRDDVTGDLYAASDFGVSRLADGTTTWTVSAPGLPNVEVPSLEILPAERILYAGTHGLSAWRLNLPK